MSMTKSSSSRNTPESPDEQHSRVAIYARAKADDADQLTPDEQEAFCRSIAARARFRVVGVFVDEAPDAGGAWPALDRLAADADAGLFHFALIAERRGIPICPDWYHEVYDRLGGRATSVSLKGKEVGIPFLAREQWGAAGTPPELEARISKAIVEWLLPRMLAEMPDPPAGWAESEEGRAAIRALTGEPEPDDDPDPEG
jgi:hypothetical protein